MATSVTTRKRAITNEQAAYWARLGPLGWLSEILKYLLLIVLAVTFMLPFIWMFSSALKDSSQVFSVPPIWIPRPALWQNFYESWTAWPFNLWLYNTVIKYAIPATVGTVVSSAIAAYGFARLEWRLRDI
ncbi:MAG: carbohydrate ABC transporter permease, partial [Chloroflexi bacterium]|nr:carbohydrate ABC transporter permease [Chloroflexota bacterium]